MRSARIDIVPAAPYLALDRSLGGPTESPVQRRIRMAFSSDAVSAAARTAGEHDLAAEEADFSFSSPSHGSPTRGQESSIALPVRELPTLAGLGGYGIDDGVDLRSGMRLRAEAWRAACERLTPAQREASIAAHPAIGVAALHAHAAGVQLAGWGEPRAPRTSAAAAAPAHLVVPIDLSGASSADGPLAPVDGADDFDAAVLAALTAGDENSLREYIDRAPCFHADLDMLGAAFDLGDSAGVRFVPDEIQACDWELFGTRVAVVTLRGTWQRRAREYRARQYSAEGRSAEDRSAGNHSAAERVSAGQRA